jgi:DNA-binding transcriptional regulator YhcF (GntR family)
MTVKSSAAAPGAAAAKNNAKDDADVDARIYQSIFDGVLDHRLTPGTKLPEPELCHLFGVGRAVVRRVLEKLAYDGIVVLRPNKGAVIAAPTPEETREIFEARRALESALVQFAVEHQGAAPAACRRTQGDAPLRSAVVGPTDKLLSFAHRQAGRQFDPAKLSDRTDYAHLADRRGVRGAG